MIQQAAALLKAGKLIGLPTETVYGLAADAKNDEAVKKIFSAKDLADLNYIIIPMIQM